MVKPGEPQTPFFHWPARTSNLATLLPGLSPTVLQRVGICPSLPHPCPSWAPTPACFSSVPHVSSPLSLCLSVSTSDIVFFGENLPARFFSCMQSVSVHSELGPCGGQSQSSGVQVLTLLLQDFSKVDLLIIMGTSLQVQPFASLISK